MAIFEHELIHLAELSDRDSQFAEIYHPLTGKIYGGLQEGQAGEWHSCVRQTWSATAFLRMILMGLFGMQFEPAGITFRPVTFGSGEIHLINLTYRNTLLNIHLTGEGRQIGKFFIDQIEQTSAFLSAGERGTKEIRIVLTDENPPSH